MLYSCNHVTTVSIKGLNKKFGYSRTDKYKTRLTLQNAVIIS